MDAADKLPNLRVGRGRDGTGVEYRNSTLFHTRGFLKADPKQLVLQGRPVSLAGATAKVKDVERHHAQTGYCSRDEGALPVSGAPFDRHTTTLTGTHRV